METETTTQQLQVTQNIPATGYSYSNEHGLHERKMVSILTEANFTFSAFAVKQLIQGFDQHLEKAFDRDYSHAVVKTQADLATKLAIYGLSDNATTISLKRAEISVLRIWLETRMKHCEEQRDIRDNAFNADTYIAQKFLLLDLREFLAGEIISD